MVWAATAIGAGTALYGAYQQNKASDAAIAAAGGVSELPRFGLQTPGGGLAGFTTPDALLTGQLQQPQFSFADLATSGLSNTSGSTPRYTPSGSRTVQPLGATASSASQDPALMEQYQRILQLPDDGMGGAIKRSLMSQFTQSNPDFGISPTEGPTGGVADAFLQSGIGGIGNEGMFFTDNAQGPSLIQTGLGDREPARAALVDLANQGLGRAGLQQGLPGNVQNAARGLTSAHRSQQEGLDLQQMLTGNALSGNNALFQSRLAEGFQTGEQARDAALENFRAQALPSQQRAVNSTLTNLFGTGRLGTTGGSNVVGRLAEAQNQQDLQFQQAAQAEGRAAQTTSDQLLQSAFGRFGQTQQLASDLGQRQFSGATNFLGAQQGLAGFTNQLRQQDLQLALQALQGEGALQSQSLDNFGAVLAAGQAEANAQVGAGSNIAQIASNPNFGASPFTGLGTAITNNAQQIGGTLKDIFSPKPSPSIVV